MQSQTVKGAPESAPCARCGRQVFEVAIKRGEPPTVLDAEQAAYIRMRDAGSHQFLFIRAQNTWAEHRCEPAKGKGKTTA